MSDIADRQGKLTDWQPIGSGGFSQVYKAYDAEFERPVAVKVFWKTDDDWLRRMSIERRAIGRLSTHPSISLPLWSGHTTDGMPFIVMEFLAGGSTQQYLQKHGPFEPAKAAAITAIVANALAYAHERGVIHKDIKPDNILLTDQLEPKLADFGIASLVDVTQLPAGHTPLFSPPELLSGAGLAASHLGDPRDERSDLYSLAATFFALLTGKSPAAYDRNGRSLTGHIIDGPIPTVGHASIDNFLARGMAKDPANRWQTAGQFESQLRMLGRSLAGAPATRIDLEPASGPQGPLVSPRSQSPPEPQGSPMPAPPFRPPAPAPPLVEPVFGHGSEVAPTSAPPPPPPSITDVPIYMHARSASDAGGGNVRLILGVVFIVVVVLLALLANIGDGDGTASPDFGRYRPPLGTPAVVLVGDGWFPVRWRCVAPHVS